MEAYPIITDPMVDQWVRVTGKADFAKGGSEKVLSGILLVMLMQNEMIPQALSNGCFIHGKAADLLVRNYHFQYDLLATIFRTFSL
ncbi:hypothetical protein NC797_18170 [Aquibacillus sp. 3ASR75-11]|uniref:YjeF C-terminal domain-containing protein n=1 Tax=Terrihalobacillus insolitus TaxID=2950438 RepID=A0A9X3WV88_9BACI|nr:NAD(P)H-hydrate dehydratase [Terrihalobacillus insolitus]MDC3415226.1 hypothetical protein [Terrihalobacillus insolitus]MDC3426377.1 hypothetical protein [Terrihalobacillus insolitus]